MKKLFNNYIETFGGLSNEVWWLALITLINRAGTMVIPFLSLYLTEDLCLTKSDVGWIMSAFGLGSVAGSWLGGKLTDKIGYYKVMVRSLVSTGILFIGLQFLNTFASLCVGIFLVMLVADMFRPAMFVALSAYSKPENKTRSVTLIRLAINLGFTAGPAVGGLIITTLSYSGLFWVDGITCILATFVLFLVLNPKKARIQDDIIVKNPESAYRDKPFLIFLVAMFLFGFVFLQYFSTMPIYYREIHVLTELQIGLLLGANGFIIFILEMPLIKWLENSKYTKSSLMFFGAVLTALSFIVLNISTWSGILIIGMFLMTIGEMIAFPFSNAFAMDRAKKGNQGEYMALYSIAFSMAHIFGHNAGMQFADGFGFDNTWAIMTFLGALCAFLLFFLNMYMKKIKPFKMSNIISLKNLDYFKPFDGLKAKLVHTDNQTIAFWKINKDAVLPLHKHIQEQVSIVTNGELELTINGVSKIIKKGMVAVIAPNAEHEARALTDVEVTDIFYPLRDDYKF